MSKNCPWCGAEPMRAGRLKRQIKWRCGSHKFGRFPWQDVNCELIAEKAEAERLREASRPTYYDGKTVHLSDVDRHVEDRQAINAVDLRTCKLYQNGQLIALSTASIVEFEMTGLATIDFFRYRMWEE